MPQHAFGREDHEWRSPRGQCLAPQHVKILHRGGRQADLQVVLGGELVRIRNVHEFRADWSTVETASERTLVSEHVKVGNRRGCETSKRIERRLEISPATERVENLFARAIALFS